mgnify:CR=1 FL=1
MSLQDIRDKYSVPHPRDFSWAYEAEINELLAIIDRMEAEKTDLPCQSVCSCCACLARQAHSPTNVEHIHTDHICQQTSRPHRAYCPCCGCKVPT